MVKEYKVQILLKLIEGKKITVDEIRNLDYKAEIEKRLASQ